MKTTRRAFAVVAMALAAVMAVELPASATDRRVVCATDVWVRPCPACSPPIGILYHGEHFDFSRNAVHNGMQWAYGFALGGENKWGWLPYSALTNASGNCQ